MIPGFNIAAGASAYRANAVAFDGATDYLVKASEFTGNANSKVSTCSFWVIHSGASVKVIMWDFSDAGYIFTTIAANSFGFQGWNTAGTRILSYSNAATTSTLNDGNWHHIVISFDLSNASNRYCYIDDIDESASGNWTTYTNDTIDWTRGGMYLMRRNDIATNYAADLAEFYWNNAEYIDLSVESNRLLFRKDKKPAFLGEDGSAPTGSAPLILLSGPTAAWHTNKGSGGGFTENGALTTAATSPSD